MRLIQLSDFIADHLGITVFPLTFPHNAAEDIAVLDIINGDFEGGVQSMNIQLMVRNSHIGNGEEFANTLIDRLNGVTNRVWENEQIILIEAGNPNPFYVGQDDNERHLYTVDFRVLTTKL